MTAGAALHSTSHHPRPQPQRHRWTKTLAPAAAADPLLPSLTKLVAQKLAWRADSLGVDELFVSRELVGKLLSDALGRRMSVGEAQRHLQALQGKAAGFKGASAWLPHPQYLVMVPQPGKRGGKTYNARGQLVAKTNVFRLGIAALAETRGESVDGFVVVAARSWRQPTRRESTYPLGASLRSAPQGGRKRLAVPAGSTGGGPSGAGGASGPVAGPPGDHASGPSDGLPAMDAPPTADAPGDVSPGPELRDVAAARAMASAAMTAAYAAWKARQPTPRLLCPPTAAERAEEERRFLVAWRSNHQREHPAGCPDMQCATCHPEGWGAL